MFYREHKCSNGSDSMTSTTDVGGNKRVEIVGFKKWLSALHIKKMAFGLFRWSTNRLVPEYEKGIIILTSILLFVLSIKI